MGQGWVKLEKVSEINAKTDIRFDDWLNTLDLEREFWAASEEYDKTVGSGAAREGLGRAKELREEVSPLVFLGKSSLSNLRRADSVLEFKTNFKNDKIDGKYEFDAMYRWRSYQSIFSGYDTKGFIEITCCLNDGHQTSLEHEYLTENKITSGHNTYKRVSGKVVVEKEGGAVDLDAGVSELSDIIVANFKMKLSKEYPQNTSLVLWLSDAANVRYESCANLSHLSEKIQKLNCQKFQSVFLVGWHIKGRWLVGDALP